MVGAIITASCRVTFAVIIGIFDKSEIKQKESRQGLRGRFKITYTKGYGSANWKCSQRLQCVCVCVCAGAVSRTGAYTFLSLCAACIAFPAARGRSSARAAALRKLATPNTMLFLHTLWSIFAFYSLQVMPSPPLSQTRVNAIPYPEWGYNN